MRSQVAQNPRQLLDESERLPRELPDVKHEPILGRNWTRKHGRRVRAFGRCEAPRRRRRSGLCSYNRAFYMGWKEERTIIELPRSFGRNAFEAKIIEAEIISILTWRLFCPEASPGGCRPERNIKRHPLITARGNKNFWRFNWASHRGSVTGLLTV
jgi:hypothetical protein